MKSFCLHILIYDLTGSGQNYFLCCRRDKVTPYLPQLLVGFSD
nr:MAG TPA: hypothetical protein [Caudoviricetes sp.]